MRKISVKKVSTLLAVPVVLLGCYFYFSGIQNNYLSVTTFDECVRLGYPITTSYPETCRMPGKSFTNPSQTALPLETSTQTITSPLYENISYSIEGELVPLTDGSYVLVNENGTTTITSYGTSSTFDSNADGTEDVHFFLTLQNNTSDKLFYLVTAFKQKTTYKGSNGVYMGENIEPLSITKQGSTIRVQYLERKSGALKPTELVKRAFKNNNDTLVEVLER